MLTQITKGNNKMINPAIKILTREETLKETIDEVEARLRYEGFTNTEDDGTEQFIYDTLYELRQGLHWNRAHRLAEIFTEQFTALELADIICKTMNKRLDGPPFSAAVG